MTDKLWASRDKPDRDPLVIFWRRKPKNDKREAKAQNKQVYWDGNYVCELTPAEARLFGVKLKTGECKCFRVMEPNDD